VAAGYRVIAPFMRGYVPSSVPSDGSYHIGALMDDALQVRAACDPTDRDVVIGHDWGALAATGLAAMPQSPFAKAVIMSVPPSAALRPDGPVRDRGKLLRLLPAQLVRSWYISYFQLPLLPERSTSWILPLLWRRWSPGYNAAEDLRHVDAAIEVAGALACRAGPIPGDNPQHPAAGPLRRTAQMVDRAAAAADAVPARRRRRLHDTGIHPVGSRCAARGQRRPGGRERRALPATRTAGDRGPADRRLPRHRLSPCPRIG
jgi:pimeloyl-ACP methyl ester carboxylesterase